MDGREAAEIGLASRCVPAARVLDTALEIARDIAAHTAPLSVAITKRLLWDSPNLTREEVEQRETEMHHVLMGAPDALEGVMAWLERRAPNWTSSVRRDWPRWPR